MKKLQRLGEILESFDTYDVFEYYKLTGQSALQFLNFDIGFLTHDLTFDLDSTLELDKINELRKLVNQVLPQLLQKINFTLDVKKSKLTGQMDMYYVIDNLSKDVYTLNFNYLNRVHILKPEYFARIDKYFGDLHIYALSTLENYARYILEFIVGTAGDKLLNDMLNRKLVLPQQYPFLRKLVLFYVSIHDDFIDIHHVDERLKEILNFSESELKYLNDARLGEFNLKLLLPEMMATKMMDHPKIKLMRRNK